MPPTPTTGIVWVLREPQPYSLSRVSWSPESGFKKSCLRNPLNPCHGSRGTSIRIFLRAFIPNALRTCIRKSQAEMPPLPPPHCVALVRSLPGAGA